MKIVGKQSKGIAKGVPSGLLISLVIHATAFLLAGLLVVFTVHQKEEKKFVPPKPISRPKMKLKKPKVKVKKMVKPKTAKRIVTKVKRVGMPDIQLPEMSGMTDGLSDGISGFDILPDMDGVTLFGEGRTIGNDFVGTFYDFKRDRKGRPLIMDTTKFVDELTKFVANGWKTSRLARFYRSPKKLYATTFMIPPTRSVVAPSAFDETDTGGWCWMAHYKGHLVYPEDIKIRFWGNGDDVLVVRVNGEVVLNACWPDGNWGSYAIGGNWISSAKNNFRFYLGNNLSRGSDWIKLKAGEPLDMEIILGEVPGGGFCSMLTVEVDGEEYERNQQGGPIFPIFKTAEPSMDLIDAIHRNMIFDEAMITNGPLFRDYVPKARANPLINTKELVGRATEKSLELKSRIWTLASGKQFEAEYIAVVGDNVVIKTSKKKQQKIQLVQLSTEDREFIELENPPKFNISFTKASSQRFIELSPFLAEEPPRISGYTFGAKTKQTSAHSYPHELAMEYYAVGKEMIGDKYILLDRQKSTFIPSKENKRSHAFSGKEVEIIEYVFDGVRRGDRYVGNLVTITDKRGKVIQYSASNPWLWEHLDNLKQIPVGRFMDKTCIRKHPTSPTPTRY